MKDVKKTIRLAIGCALLFILLSQVIAMGSDTSPPASQVKLIFIHHSTGENWLSDENGGLGSVLMQNNYFVSDTYYGWGPDSIGDRTDIGNWYEWFNGPSSSTYLSALYAESSQSSSYSRLSSDPGGENIVVMFKSCFPNSNLGGNSGNPPTSGDNPLRGQDASSEYMTVENAKGIYIDLLNYFATRQDKLFVAITAPPLSSSETSSGYAANARAFNNWLINEWLAGYPYKNVAVFDFYNVLTSNGGSSNVNDAGLSGGNHHRWWNGAVEHVQTLTSNISAYPTASDDSHPTQAGNRKATQEFIPLLNYFYNQWKAQAPALCTMSPVADIKANGSDARISISEGDPLAITISLDPVCHAGVSGDWWLVASTPDGLIFFDVSGGTLAWQKGFSVSLKYPLITLPSYQVPALSDMRAGSYTFYFGVDMNMNGSLDMDSLAYDSVGVEVLPASQTPGQSSLQPADFQYLGAFRLPDGGERPLTFEYGGNAMTYYPDGDPTDGGDEIDDGYHGSLFISGHERMPYGELPDGNQVAEVTIPVPVNSKDLGALNYAQFVQGFKDVTGGLFAAYDEIPRMGMEYLNHPVTGPKIHLSFGQHFHMTPEQQMPTHAWFDIDLSTPDTKGAWYIGNQTLYSVNEYIFAIPQTWADTNTGGRVLATGRSRSGGLSGMGPALFAYKPWDNNGNPYQAGTRLSETVLLQYAASTVTSDIERCLNNYQAPDEWHGGAWITSSTGKTGVLFAGTKSNGTKYWYGYVNAEGPDLPCVDSAQASEAWLCRLSDGTPCPDSDRKECTHTSEKGWWSTRFDAQILLYSPDDLASVATGQTQPYEPQPYAVMDIDDYLYLPDSSETIGYGTRNQRLDRISDVAYDRAHDLLFILENMADGAKPVVHVWRVR